MITFIDPPHHRDMAASCEQCGAAWVNGVMTHDKDCQFLRWLDNLDIEAD